MEMAIDEAPRTREERLTEQRRALPDEPGVYLFRDAARARRLRRQGEVDPQAGRLALLEPDDLRDDRAARRDRPHRVPRRPDRGRGAARRAELHQAVPAAVQHPAARRQVVSVHRDLARRGVPARVLHARAPPPRARLLRPVRERQARARHARPARQGLPDPLLRGGRAGAALGLAVPGLLHQALRGALRRLRDEGAVPRGHRRRDRVPVGPLPRDRARPRAADALRRRRAGLRAGDDRAQPAAGRAGAARAPARRQRGLGLVRRGGAGGGRHRGQRAGLPGPRRRALATASRSTSTTRAPTTSPGPPRSSCSSTTRARSGSRR